MPDAMSRDKEPPGTAGTSPGIILPATREWIVRAAENKVRLHAALAT